MAHALSALPLEKQPAISSPSSAIVPSNSSLTLLQPRDGVSLGWYLMTAYMPLLVSTTWVLGELALRTLKNIFQGIIDQLLDNWAHSPPRNHVIIEAGRLRLGFGCTVNPVPWEFIREYAMFKLDAVDRGFAPVYAREWWFAKGQEPNITRFCYAGMRVGDLGDKIALPAVMPEFPLPAMEPDL